MAPNRHSTEEEDEDLELEELEPSPHQASFDNERLLRSYSTDTAQRETPQARWMDNAPKRLRKYVLAFAVFTGLALLYEYYLVFFAKPFGDSSGVQLSPYAARYGKGAHWRGWAAVDNVFIFGDSWTSTGFEIDGEQPSRTNPMGNPEYAPPDDFDRLGAGTNWVSFLTGMHNQSFVETVNLAYGGATVDMELIHPFESIPPDMRPLKYQIEEQFIPSYASASPLTRWSNESTLFIIWIGVNDIHNATPETSLLFGRVFEEFAQFIDKLYQVGARNFLFMNIPPIERSPLAAKIEQVEPWKSWVATWNQNVTALASNLSSAYAESTCFVFDTYQLYDTVIDDPCSHPETCEYRDTTSFCDMYIFGSDHWNSSSANCTYRIDEYLWMNDLHPTTRLHNLTALMMAEALT